MSQQNLRSLHGMSYNERKNLVSTSIYKEENFQQESPKMRFPVKVKVEHCNSDDEYDSVSTNPITNSSESSGKIPDEKLSDFLAILEQCTTSLNVTEDVILLDGNGDFELSELVLNSENLAEKDSYIKRIQAQLDEEIMRDIEAEAKIFEAIQVSLKKKSKENMSMSKVVTRTEVIAENGDMCESGLIIVDSGVEDIATIKDSVEEGTENNFHSEIVNWNKATDYSDDDDAEDITHISVGYDPNGYKINNKLVKEMLENLCKEHSKELVKDKRHTSTFTQIEKNYKVSFNNEETKGICIKSKRKMQTTKNSIATKKAKFQNNNEDAGETDLVSKTNFKKNTFVIKKQNNQGPLFKKTVDVSSKRKSKETNTYVVTKKQKIKTPNKYKHTEKGNIKDARKPVMNTNFPKFKCNECDKEFSTKDILTDHILKCMKPKPLVNDSQLKKADALNSLLSEVYNCDICTFKTNQKHAIETHLKMHTTTKWLSCDICEYRCATKSTLIGHIRTHTGEKPFTCNICEFRCSQKRTLIVHIRTHTHSKELVKDKRHTSTFTQIEKNDKVSFNNEKTKGICIKSKRKLQTTKKSIATKKAKFQNNNEDAGETDLVSKTNFKNTFVIKKQNNQGPLFKKTVDVSSKRKSKETNTYVVTKKQKIKTPNKYKHTEKGNIKDARKPVMNTNFPKFKCNECDKEFSTKDILTDHILKCMKPKPLVNDSQLKKGDALNSLLSEVYNCDICTFKTNQKRSIETHLKIHSTTKGLSCDICEYRCATKSTLIVHIRTHTGEKPFTCNICKFRCSQKSTLIVHIRTHTGEKPFICNICEFRCSQKSTLKQHIRTHTGKKPFTCNICEFRCSRKSTLKDHIRTHTGGKPFSCNICKYKCSKKSHLKYHMRTHTGEKPFSCNICQFRCATTSTLIVHIRTHTGEKPFICNICEFRCSQKSHLNNHMKTHTGEKPFSCNICEYRCSLKSTLKDHVRTHTGEKRFCCNICDYRCATKSTLIVHIRTHTGKKPFCCNICDYRCSQKSHLNKHVKTHR